MQPPKSTQSVSQRALLNIGILHGGKNVPNADKFEKFELLKERFKTYRENVLKVGFENLLKTHPALGGSCQNVQSSNFNIYSSTSSSPSSSFNNLHKQAPANPNCSCSYCVYCAQQKVILTEIAYLNNLEHDIKEIRDYLRDTRKKLETKELKVKLASDWKQIALVLDRTFFFIYLVFTITILFIMKSKEAPVLVPRANATNFMPTTTVPPAVGNDSFSTTTASILNSISQAVNSIT
jgi:hypothetical protein